MTRAKALAIVVNARERRRNIAAGRLTLGENKVAEAKASIDREERNHAARVDESMTKLIEAGSPRAFHELEMERYYFAESMQTAEKGLQAAQQHCEAQRAVLRTEERALRQAETLRDREREARHARNNKAEQIASDERSATESATRGRR